MMDVKAEVADCPLGAFHARLALLMGAVLFFDGYDLFNAAYVAPFVRAEWRLDPEQLGVLLSAGIAGLAVGSITVGRAADRLGRRTMVIAALWLISFASAGLAILSTGFAAFIALRLLLGFGLGMVTPLALTYLNEWSPRRTANRFATGVFVVGFASGGIAAGLVGIFMAPVFGWRSLYSVGALSVAVAVACHWWLPESLQFLASKQRWSQLRSTLMIFRPDRSMVYATTNVFVIPDPAMPGAVASLAVVLKSPSTVVIWLVGALSLFCVHGLTNWLPSVMIGRGSSMTTAFSLTIVVMVAQILGGLGTGWLADRWRNRRLIMAITFGASAATTLGIGLVSGIGMITVLLGLSAGFLFGAQAVMNNFTALSYPASVRATGTGLAVGIARLGGVLGPFVIGVLQLHWPSFLVVFIALSSALAAAAVGILFARPDLESAPV